MPCSAASASMAGTLAPCMRERSTRPVKRPSSSTSIREATARSAPTSRAIGRTVSSVEAETMTTSWPARWCASMMSRASA